MDKYLISSELPIYDEEISNIMEELLIKSHDSGRYVIGFRNESGRIYRKIFLDGLSCIIRLKACLLKHGYHDELDGTHFEQDGYSAVYFK
ncbi:hypothetical protein [Aliivibrio fischeri]|uniref:hypothetical protein n=1 Tax=Aliivibrio fischeri TaxID=668 RepID=UPI00080DCF0A|nr:hypothetical protein [Aliivibrio fischeri]OCH43077.1 hypothetical protein A6D99_00415 [Aliivibrio fischeri]